MTIKHHNGKGGAVAAAATTAVGTAAAMALARFCKILSVMPMRLRNGHQELAWRRGARAQHQEGARQGSQQHIRRGTASGTARLGHLRCHSAKELRSYRPGEDAATAFCAQIRAAGHDSCSDPAAETPLCQRAAPALAPLRTEGGSWRLTTALCLEFS